jgi:hypothetical protein
MATALIDPPLQGEGDRRTQSGGGGVSPSIDSATPLRQPLRGCHLPLQGRIG